jgi:hypothetical protein
MLKRFICGLNVSPTKKYTKVSCNTTDSQYIDNICFTDPKKTTTIQKQQRIIKDNKVQPRTTKNNKGQQKTKKNYKKRYAFLLKFINCLKC